MLLWLWKLLTLGAAIAYVTSHTKVVVFSDLHIPYQDSRGVGLLHDVIKTEKPTYIVCNGDFIDVQAIGKFADTDAEHSFEDEINVADDMLDYLGVTHWVFGNHEHRTFRKSYMTKQLRESFHLPTRLNLRQRGIKWFPYSSAFEDVLCINDTVIVHGFGGGGQTHGMQHARRFGRCITGHTHRSAKTVEGRWEGAAYCWEGGCLCKPLEYMKERQPTGWQHALTVAHFLKSGRSIIRVYDLNGDVIPIEGTCYETGQAICTKSDYLF